MKFLISNKNFTYNYSFLSLIFAVERDGPDEEKWTFYDSFWWGLMTLTTVGYNLTPITFFGKKSNKKHLFSGRATNRLSPFP